MRLVGAGLALVLLGFAVLLAMVARAVEPQMALSLAAFAALFGGMLLAVAGLARRRG